METVQHPYRGGLTLWIRLALTAVMLAGTVGVSGVLAAPASARGVDVVATVLVDGDTLQPGQALLSPNGAYILIMQNDGNLVEYVQSQGDPIWDSNTGGNPGAYATLQTDGNFVVYSAGGVALWASDTSGNPGDRLVLQSDANLVIYSSHGQHLWLNATGGAIGWILPFGGVLQSGQSLVSPNMAYMARMQTDGNFVVSDAFGWYFQTGTEGNKGAHLSLQADGNLVVYSAEGVALWSSQTEGSGTRSLAMQPDSNLVGYAPTSSGESATWDSDPEVRGTYEQLALATLGSDANTSASVINSGVGGVFTSIWGQAGSAILYQGPGNQQYQFFYNLTRAASSPVVQSGVSPATDSALMSNLSGLLTAANALNQSEQPQLQLQSADLTQTYALINDLTALVKSLIP